MFQGILRDLFRIKRRQRKLAISPNLFAEWIHGKRYKINRKIDRERKRTLQVFGLPRDSSFG